MGPIESGEPKSQYTTTERVPRGPGQTGESMHNGSSSSSSMFRQCQLSLGVACFGSWPAVRHTISHDSCGAATMAARAAAGIPPPTWHVLSPLLCDAPCTYQSGSASCRTASYCMACGAAMMARCGSVDCCGGCAVRHGGAPPEAPESSEMPICPVSGGVS